LLIHGGKLAVIGIDLKYFTLATLYQSGYALFVRQKGRVDLGVNLFAAPPLRDISNVRQMADDNSFQAQK